MSNTLLGINLDSLTKPQRKAVRTRFYNSFRGGKKGYKRLRRAGIRHKSLDYLATPNLPLL